jgi:uncharacterized protein
VTLHSIELFTEYEEAKRFLALPGGHFDAYTGEAFQTSSAAQRDWFVHHLAGG